MQVDRRALPFIPLLDTPAQPIEAMRAATSTHGSHLPSYTRSQASADAKNLYEAGHGGWRSLNTDEDRIFDILRPLRAADIALLGEVYQQHYRQEMKAALVQELSEDTTDVLHVQALLQGKENAAQIQAIEVDAEIQGIFGKNARVLSLLENLAPDARQKLAHAYAALHGQSLSGRAARQYLVDRFNAQFTTKDFETERMEALLLPPAAGDEEAWAAADARYGALQTKAALDDRDYDKLAKILETRTASQIAQLEHSFNTDPTRARTLRQQIDAIRNTPQRKLLQLLYAPKPWDPIWTSDVACWRVDLLLQGINDTAGLRHLIMSQTREALDLLRVRYNHHHPFPQDHFDTMLKQSLSETDFGEIQHQLNKPYLASALAQSAISATQWQAQVGAWKSRADAWAVRRAVDGLGADVALLRTILSNQTPQKMRTLLTDYSVISNGEKLRDRLTQGWFSELQGRDQVDLVDQYLDHGSLDPAKGADLARQQRYERLRMRQQHESSDVLGRFALHATGVLERTFNRDPLYKTPAERLAHSLDEAERSMAAGDDKKADDFLQFSEQDLQSLATNQADWSAMLVTGITVLTSVATAGVTSSIIAAALAARNASLAAGLTSLSLNSKAGMQNILDDAFLGAVGGASAYLPAAKMLGAGTSASSRYADDLISASVLGGQSAATVGAADSALQRETWENGPGQGIANVLTVGALSGGSGMLIGGMWARTASFNRRALEQFRRAPVEAERLAEPIPISRALAKREQAAPPAPKAKPPPKLTLVGKDLKPDPQPVLPDAGGGAVVLPFRSRQSPSPKTDDKG